MQETKWYVWVVYFMVLCLIEPFLQDRIHTTLSFCREVISMCEKLLSFDRNVLFAYPATLAFHCFHCVCGIGLRSKHHIAKTPAGLGLSVIHNDNWGRRRGGLVQSTRTKRSWLSYLKPALEIGKKIQSQFCDYCSFGNLVANWNILVAKVNVSLL